MFFIPFWIQEVYSSFGISANIAGVVLLSTAKNSIIASTVFPSASSQVGHTSCTIVLVVSSPPNPLRAPSSPRTPMNRTKWSPSVAGHALARLKPQETATASWSNRLIHLSAATTWSIRKTACKDAARCAIKRRATCGRMIAILRLVAMTSRASRCYQGGSRRRRDSRKKWENQSAAKEQSDKRARDKRAKRRNKTKNKIHIR